MISFPEPPEGDVFFEYTYHDPAMQAVVRKGHVPSLTRKQATAVIGWSRWWYCIAHGESV